MKNNNFFNLTWSRLDVKLTTWFFKDESAQWFHIYSNSIFIQFYKWLFSIFYYKYYTNNNNNNCLSLSTP